MVLTQRHAVILDLKRQRSEVKGQRSEVKGQRSAGVTVTSPGHPPGRAVQRAAAGAAIQPQHHRPGQVSHLVCSRSGITGSQQRGQEATQHQHPHLNNNNNNNNNNRK
ncbi:hypothetical protein EYF80_037478 [Liparis tanakae]|uniref:Uncharacterized protein n=1 Tax=Liparis tanakae TaxID=230148 RepID=A0A4Z2GHT9_9TELE|nr:hypothetical protein EYF80_037478 [Liparis tanakae]